MKNKRNWQKNDKKFLTEWNQKKEKHSSSLKKKRRINHHNQVKNRKRSQEIGHLTNMLLLRRTKCHMFCALTQWVKIDNLHKKKEIML